MSKSLTRKDNATPSEQDQQLFRVLSRVLLFLSIFLFVLPSHSVASLHVHCLADGMHLLYFIFKRKKRPNLFSIMLPSQLARWHFDEEEGSSRQTVVVEAPG
ncbi:hypothetical protein V8F33_005291 [Rhypophila sp. PSN 637]